MSTPDTDDARDAAAWRLLTERLTMADLDISDLDMRRHDVRLAPLFTNVRLDLLAVLAAVHDALALRAQP